MNAKLPPGMGDGRALAQAIVDTLPEPLLILDHDLRVVVASRSYYRAFKVAGRMCKAARCTRWATVSGTFLNSGGCWRKSLPNRPR
jgi:hypothetical protein